MGWRSALGPRAMFGNFGNLVHTFSDFDVDVLSHLELRERGDCPVLLLGPIEELLIAVGKGLLLYAGEEGEVFRLKPDLWAQRYLEEKKKSRSVRNKGTVGIKRYLLYITCFLQFFQLSSRPTQFQRKCFLLKVFHLLRITCTSMLLILIASQKYKL